MRTKRWIVISAALLVGIFAVALMILFTMDLSRFKDDFEHYASRATGREFTIGGEFQATLGRSIFLRAEDVRLANAGWSSSPDMLRIGDLELHVNLWSLLRGPIWIQYLKLERTRFVVEANPDGRLNWSFDPATKAAQWLESRGVTQYVLERADIEDFDLRYGDGWLDTARTLQIDHGTTEDTSNDRVALNLTGRLDDLNFEATSHAGPLDNLLDGEDVDLDISVNLGEFRFDARGSVGRMSPLQRPEFAFEISGPEISALLTDVGLPVVTSGPVDMRGNLDQQALGLKLDVTGTVGEFNLDLHATLDDADRFEGLVTRFEASGPNLDQFARVLNIDYLPADAFRLSGQVDGEKLPFSLHNVSLVIGEVSAGIDGTFGNEEIDLQVRGKGADFDEFLDYWTERTLPEEAFEVTGGARRRYDSGVWHVSEVVTTLESGLELTIDGSLDPTQSFLGVNAKVGATGPELSDVLSLWLENPAPLGPFEATAQLQKGEHETRFHDVEARLGEALRQPGDASAANHLAGTILYRPGDIPSVTAELKSDGIDLTPYLGSEDGQYPGPESKQVAADRFIPDAKLPRRYVQLANLNIRLAGDELKLGEFRATSVDVGMQLHDGTLSLDPVRGNFRNGTVSGQLTLDSTGENPLLTTELQARDIVWNELYDEEGNDLQQASWDVDAKLTAQGAGLRELLAASNGSVRMEESAGFIQNEPLTALLSAINPPSAEEEYTKLDCHVAIFDIRNGIVSARALAIQTDKLKIAARGTVNLQNEAINLRFKIAERAGIGVSAISVVSPLVSISGTLQEPTVNFVTGAGVAAVITEGWTLLLDAFADMTKAGDNVCEQSLRRAGGARHLE